MTRVRRHDGGVTGCGRGWMGPPGATSLSAEGRGKPAKLAPDKKELRASRAVERQRRSIIRPPILREPPTDHHQHPPSSSP